ncbi:MAG: hypothetical protein FWD57_02870 [Polyangiaceae bacterium]|nr:hypothetical protein [Polyangiaceae bacterium]
MQNAECRMQNAECRLQNAECRMQIAECRMQNAECRLQNAECRMQIAECRNETTLGTAQDKPQRVSSHISADSEKGRETTCVSFDSDGIFYGDNWNEPTLPWDASLTGCEVVGDSLFLPSDASLRDAGSAIRSSSRS